MSTRLNQDGYEITNLTAANKVRKSEKVHRLVALAFLPNPDNLPEVNHKNCIRHDNRVENLEWISRKDNRAYTSQCGNKSKKLVKCIETGEIFTTTTEAARVNGGNPGNIRKAARN